jgi:hypothetical protein
MHTQGKQPVWQAVEENPASWRLAQKLGFVPVDELALFESRKPTSSLYSEARPIDQSSSLQIRQSQRAR